MLVSLCIKLFIFYASKTPYENVDFLHYNVHKKYIYVEIYINVQLDDALTNTRSFNYSALYICKKK